MTKFEALKKFVVRKRTFRWSDLSRHFGYPSSSLNSYTTYLNTLRRSGFVQSTGRGTYKVLDANVLRKTTLTDVTRIIQIQDLTKRTYDAEKENRKLMAHNLQLESELSLTQRKVEQTKDLLTRYQDMCNTRNERITQLTDMVASRDARLNAYEKSWMYKIWSLFNG